MNVQSCIETPRLLLKPLTVSHCNFIIQLVNSEGWLKFIGNRNVTSLIEANAYILKILENNNVTYWVVELKNTQEPIGVITYIKRDYLQHRDIGFAFLPHFSNQGYAYEATKVVLNKVIDEHKLSYILATTIPENVSSIKLLKKIGLQFEKEIKIENKTLHLYGRSIEKLKI